MSNTKPSFCIIAPTAYLEKYAVLSNKHLVLAHLVEADETYASFYKRMRDRGDYIIMDNSAFELGESYAPDKLIELAGRCGANAIVLPDYPGKAPKYTIEAAEQWIPLFKKAGYECMFVPQSEKGDWEGWVHAYQYAATNPNIDVIGMSILGIPNALPHIHVAYARVVATQILKDRGILSSTKKHHYLGLNSGPNLEIPSLLKMDALFSCDSSGPVWAGILGHAYTNEADSFQQNKKIKAHVQFDYPLVKDQTTLDRIQHNVEMTLNLFK